ncbi:MAG TPA: hypothetical protein VH107_10090, partial [Lacipirellulaceae bacterium]|nr:hypothetical protein [Lacipirellulaceae bacterium]
MPLFTSKSDGPLALTSVPMLTPGCAPPPASGSARLYIIAVQIEATKSAMTKRTYPEDFGTTFAAMPIAGPANSDEDPWIFK